MSFFAGFVDGVFKGKDWREAKNDRKRKREMEDQRWDWEKEDRDHTISQRGRAVGIQAEEDQAVSEAEARAARIRASQEQAMGGRQNREMSVTPAVPGNTATEARAEAQPQRRDQRGALSVMPGLGDVGAGAGGRSMGEAVTQSGQRPAQVPLSMGERVAQQQASVQPEPSRQRAASLPDPELVAEGGRIAGIQPYVPGEDRGATPPPAQRGFNLNNLIASPAAASTLPDERQPPDMRGRATQDALQGRGQGYSDYTEATRGFRSDAPQRGTEAEMVARAQQAQNTTTPSQGAQARAGRVRDTARGMVPDRDPVTAITENLTLRGMGIAGVASDAVGMAQSAVGATEAGARSFDRADGMREARDRLKAERSRTAQTPTPAGATETQSQSARTPEQRAEQREAAPGAYSFNLGGAEMSVSRANRKLTGTVADTAAEIAGAFDRTGQITGSMKAAGDAITRSPALSAADALAGDKPKQSEVRAAARQASVRFQKEEVERHARVLESEGMLKEAAAWREYAQSENTRKAMEKLSEAMFYWNMNDESRALQSVVELYNMNGYYDDGLSALSEGTAFQYDPQGNISGLTVTFRDEASGEVFQQTINGPRDKVMAMVIGGLSPEATFAAAMEAVGGISEPQQEAPARMSYADARKKALTELKEGLMPGTQLTNEQIEERTRLILQGEGMMEPDVPFME